MTVGEGRTVVGRVLGEGRYLAECFVPMVVGSPRDLVRMGKKYEEKNIFGFFGFWKRSSVIIEWQINFSTIVVSNR